MKSVVAIHDLSCHAKSSLTVVIPTLAALKVEASVLPTALLSTQTDGFDSYMYKDLTSSMKEVLKHWDSLDLFFNGIYSGFLGSEEQISIVSSLIDHHRENQKETLVVVDPVLGDDGKPYGPVSDELVAKMSHLVQMADVITPNTTEAALLLNKEYKKEVSLKEAKTWLPLLAEMGPRYVVITSVMDNLRGSVVGFDKQTNQLSVASHSYVPVSYPGCGDLFASILSALMVQGYSFDHAVKRSDYLVSEAVYASWKANVEVREGVAVELIMDKLIKERK